MIACRIPMLVSGAGRAPVLVSVACRAALLTRSAFLSALVMAIAMAGPGTAQAGVRVFVTNEKSDNVTVIDAGTREVIKTIALGKRPRGVAASPDGRRVYISNSNSNSLSVSDAVTLA